MIDAHVHIITQSIYESSKNDLGINKKNFNNFQMVFENCTIEEQKKDWLKVMDEQHIDTAVFMGFSSGNKEYISFINSSKRFAGFTSVNPTKPEALKKVEKDIKSGLIGLKLYPSVFGFSVADKKAYPIYEFCNTHKIPIVIHFGVTISPVCDLRFANPLELSPVINTFPALPFVIAHFGAGFFREILMLSYKKSNVYMDTSGTNNWLCFHPYNLNLMDVFKQALNVVGADHIIFGTDSRIGPDPYRDHILLQQKSILNLLLPKKDVEMVMGENAKRIFRLHHK